MSHQEIVLIVELTSKQECIEETKAILQGLLAPTRQEEGCISYLMHQDLNSPEVFTFVETWASAEAIAAHEKTPHLQSAFANLADKLAAAPKISQHAVVV